jgi:sporulation protein YlmC with PRC-barrel domain
MTRNLIAACALALGSSLALAEDPALNVPNTPPDSGANYQPEQIQLFDSSVIENTKVTDKDGKHLGKVERLLIDSLTGRVRFVVVEVDKEWSLNNPDVIIPWGTLQIAPQGEKNYTVRIDATRDKLLNAPHFDKALTQQLTTGESGEHIYSYWGVTWREEANHSGTAKAPAPLPPVTTPGAEPNLNATPPVTTSTSPSPILRGSPSALPPAIPGTPPSPITTTDGSASNQAIGNSGTSDSPKPEDKIGQPAPTPTTPTTPPKESDLSTAPDRTRGGDESD